MMNFIYQVEDGKGVLKVTNKKTSLPPTTIECDAYDGTKIDNDAVLKAVQDWMDALGLTDQEYQVFVRIH